MHIGLTRYICKSMHINAASQAVPKHVSCRYAKEVLYIEREIGIDLRVHLQLCTYVCIHLHIYVQPARPLFFFFHSIPPKAKVGTVGRTP